MPDYSLGRAHGKIEIDYDGSGADKAARDIERVAGESNDLDKSLNKTQRSLRDTEREFDRAGDSADHYGRSVRDVDHEHESLHTSHQRTRRDLDDFSDGADKAETSASGLSRALHAAADAAVVFGPEADGAASAAERLGDAFGAKLGSSVANSGQHLRDFVKHIASFEATVGKVSGLSLAVPSLGGLAGLGGAGLLQGITEVAGAVRQLSGALGLLPAVVSGVGISLGTLKIAFHGVGDALKDMMADDPKKFLDDIRNMGPAAAESMLQVAQFRNQFKIAGATIQDSFFKQMAADIAPLIQTWLPALTQGMSQIAGVFGKMADQFAKLLLQPQIMTQFQGFVHNIAAGLQAMAPAMKPLLDIFTNLTVVGSGFFQQIGGAITQIASFFAQVTDKAAASGALQRWIQAGIHGFEHLVNIFYAVGVAFNRIMDIADRFGGGGLLGWLEKLSAQLAGWTQSAPGQKALTDFFSTLRQATDAFTPMLQPLLQGLASLGGAFTQLGVGIAPGWQTFFNTFSQTMGQLGPQIVALAPSLNSFLVGLSRAFAQLMASIGPQLPQIFQTLAGAFLALIPQIQPLTAAFLQLVSSVGPQLPKLFEAISGFLVSTEPYWPVIIGFVRDFVSALTGLISGAGDVSGFFTNLAGKLQSALMPVLAKLGEDGGKALLSGLVKGLADATGLTAAINQTKNIVGKISDFFQKSPAKKGPFSGDGYTLIRGRKMITDMAAGMTAATPAIQSAAASSMGALSSAIGVATRGSSAGAPAPGGAGTEGGSILPDRIIGADTSVLDAYLHHEFDPNRGLKGLAKQLGSMVQIAQGATNLMQNYVLNPFTQILGLITGSVGSGTAKWKKTVSDADLAKQNQQDLQRKALEEAQNQQPTWADVFGPGTGAAGGLQALRPPLGLTSTSSKADIQKAIIAAGRGRGLSDADIQTALAVAAAESGFNPASPTQMQGGHPVGGLFQQGPAFGTTAQALDPNHAINAFYDAFQTQLAKNPTSPLMAAVLTQNPQLGANAQGSAYWNAVAAQLGTAGNILQNVGAGVTAPSWAQILGTTGASTANITENPASRALQIPSAPNVEAGVRATKGLTPLYATSGPGAYQVPAWAQQLGAMFGLTASTYSGGGSLHQMGYAFDFNGPQQGRDALAKFISTNLAQQTLQLIYQSSTGQKFGIASGQAVGPGTAQPGYYAGDFAGHADHVHFATDVPPIIVSPGGVGMTLPSGQKLGDIADNTKQSLSVNQQILQDYLRGNPALGAQINAATGPGATNEQTLSALNNISDTINGLKTQDASGNKNIISALQEQQQKIATAGGFTQGGAAGGGAISTIQGIAGAAANIATSIFNVIQGALNAAGATQDILDHLVYGLRDTNDVNKLVDDFQTYLTVAADAANATGNILQTIGAIAGAGSGAPGGGEAAGAVSAAGAITQLVAGAIEGVNAAIDLGQQIYQWVSGVYGRFESYLVGGAQGALLGDVRFLLNKNTGQYITYSELNPGDKRLFTVPTALNSTYDYLGGGNPNPTVNQQLNIYAGPGQSAADMMSESMWLINTAPTGALAGANF